MEDPAEEVSLGFDSLRIGDEVVRHEFNAVFHVGGAVRNAVLDGLWTILDYELEIRMSFRDLEADETFAATNVHEYCLVAEGGEIVFSGGNDWGVTFVGVAEVFHGVGEALRFVGVGA